MVAWAAVSGGAPPRGRGGAPRRADRPRRRRGSARLAAACTALLMAGAWASASTALLVADAWAAGDGMADPLPGAAPGDVERGRAIVANRQVGLCLLCHSAPIPEEPFQGNLAPDLAGAGERATAAQLRQRLVDPGSLNPASIMPAYYRTGGLAYVAPQYRGKTIFTAQQVEDVVAYLQTLRTQFAQPPQAPQMPLLPHAAQPPQPSQPPQPAGPVREPR